MPHPSWATWRPARGHRESAPPELSHVDAGLGWNILTFRGETLLRHGGESDGFRGLVSFMPYRKLGVVCLANLHQTWLPYVITYAVYEQVLGMEAIPWHQRFTPAAGGVQPVRQDVADQDEGETPSAQVLDGYAGEFAHLGYGALSIRVAAGRLQVVLNGQPGELVPRQLDDFAITFAGPTWRHAYRGVAVRNGAGAVERVAIPVEPLVKPIVFSRI